MSKVQLKDNVGNSIFPVTTADAVSIIPNGETLHSRLDSVKSEIIELSKKANNAVASVNSKAEIMDGNTSNQYTWSGEYINETLSYENSKKARFILAFSFCHILKV